MFRISIFHLQERSYAVCCNLVCLDTSCCYEGEGITALNGMNKINHQILCILLHYIQNAVLIHMQQDHENTIFFP